MMEYKNAVPCHQNDLMGNLQIKREFVLGGVLGTMAGCDKTVQSLFAALIIPKTCNFCSLRESVSARFP